MQNTDGTNSPPEDHSSAKPTSFGRKVRDGARRVPTPLAVLGTAAALSVVAVTSAFTAPEPQNPGPAAAPPAPAAAPVHPDGLTPSPAAAARPPAPAPAGLPPAPAPEQSESVQDKIVKSARAEVGTKSTDDNCQKYSGQCVEWCGLFAMWTWQQAGVNVDPDQYAFTGNVYKAGEAKGTAYDSQHLDEAKPGDVVLYGTGPDSPSTSKHIGVVEKVEGETITTVEGNSSPKADRVARSEHTLSSNTFYGGVHPWETNH